MKTLRWILTTAILGGAVFGFVQWRRRGEVPVEARLEQLTKAELYGRVRAAGIEGRSRMNKADLIHALAACTAERPEVRLLSAALR